MVIFTPFTPFHLGPGIFLGLMFKKRLHIPTFILGNIVLDLEHIFSFLLFSRYSFHGIMHTFILAFIIGLFLGFFMYFLENSFHDLYKTFRLEFDVECSLNCFLYSGILGTLLHVLFDSPLYDDIQPFYPLTYNPLYHPELTYSIYIFCSILFMFGVFYWLILMYRRS
ncbi:MAG: hydrolase [Candidatus Methanomethylicia archaeon]